MSSPRTLIADDQPDVLDALRLLLKQEGFQVEAVTSPAAVLDSVRQREFDVVLMDLNYARDTTSGQEGLDLVSRIRTVDSGLPVVVMTAWGTIPLAVEAMRRGVRDFVQKPWDNEALLRTLRTQIDSRREDNRLRASSEVGSRHDLEEALEIQKALMPSQLPRCPAWDLALSWRPAEIVSGDYADVLRLDDHRLAIVIADVSGKGLPAALLMSNLQAAVHTVAGEPHTPAQLASRSNRILCSNTRPGRFVTFFYGLLDDRTKRLSYSNAGHCCPVLVRANGRTERLDRGGPVLGVFPQTDYEDGEAAIFPGDKIVLFTDGITEIESAAGEEFGEERLVELLIASRKLDALRIQQKVLDTIRDFSGDRFRDDATLVIAGIM